MGLLSATMMRPLPSEKSWLEDSSEMGRGGRFVLVQSSGRLGKAIEVCRKGHQMSLVRYPWDQWI